MRGQINSGRTPGEEDTLMQRSNIDLSNKQVVKSLLIKTMPFAGVNAVETISEFIVSAIFGNFSDDAAAALNFISLIQQGYYALLGSVFNPMGNYVGQLYGKISEIEGSIAERNIDEVPLVSGSGTAASESDSPERIEDRPGQANINRMREQIRGVVHVSSIAALLASIPLAIGVGYSGPLLSSLGVSDSIVEMVNQFVFPYAFAIPGSMLLQILVDFTSYCGGERSLLGLNLLGNGLRILSVVLLRYADNSTSSRGAGMLGWGSVISTYVSLTAYLIYLVKSKRFKDYKLLSINFGLLKNSLFTLLRIVKLGLPVSLFNSAEFAGLLYVSILLDQLGNNSLTINQVVKQYSGLIAILTNAFTQASSVFVSNFSGDNFVNYGHILARRKYTTFACGFTLSACLLGLIIVTDPHFFSRIISPALNSYSGSALRLIFLINVFKLMSNNVNSQYIANSQSMLSTWVPYGGNIATLGLTIIASKLLAFNAGVGVAGFYIAQFFVFAVFGRFQYRFFNFQSNVFRGREAEEPAVEPTLGVDRFNRAPLLSKLGILSGCFTVKSLDCSSEDSRCFLSSCA